MAPADPSLGGKYLYVAGRSTFGDNFDLQAEPDNRFRFYAGSGAPAASANTLVASRWYFVCGTFDTATDTSAIYLDGALQSMSNVGTHLARDSVFTIGASNTFGLRDFLGRLDEVAIYQRALTAAEVLAIYNSAGLFADGFE